MKYVSIILVSIIFLYSCSLFESPSGSASIVSLVINDTETTSTCKAFIEIVNTGKSNIYSSTISVNANSNLSSYYSSSSYSAVILPNKKYYVSMQFVITKNQDDQVEEEIWNTNLIEIVEQYYE